MRKIRCESWNQPYKRMVFGWLPDQRQNGHVRDYAYRNCCMICPPPVSNDVRAPSRETHLDLPPDLLLDILLDHLILVQAFQDKEERLCWRLGPRQVDLPEMTYLISMCPH